MAGRLGKTPIIIELKTRPETPEDLLEAQLYALGASELMKSESEIIVLHIYVYYNKATVKKEDLELVNLNLQKQNLKIFQKTASWIPFDALSPNYTVGEWCEYCECKNTCSEYR